MRSTRFLPASVTPVRVDPAVPQRLGSPENTRIGRDIFLVVTAEGVVRDANAACLEKMGDSVLGQSLIETKRMRALGGDVLSLLEKCTTSPRAVPGAVVLTDEDGNHWPWACEAVALASGEILMRHRIIGVAEATENEILEDKVEELVDEVERRTAAEAAALELAAAKSRFLAAASHDLRQPLHAMTLFTRALGRRVQSDEKRELVEHMEVALASLRRMFDALLDVSKIDGGLINPVMSEMPLSAVLKPIGVDLTARAQERGLRARVCPIEANIRTDRALFETILRNLVNNAVKFTRTGGILVGARRRSDHVLVEIVDTGIGIPDERLRKVFDEFERGRSAARGQNDGLGLGLSIVARLAELLGIELQLQSRVGHGTRATLKVPLARKQQTREPRNEIRPSVTEMRKLPFSGRTIVILDDEPLVVAGMAHELADQGAEVIQAHSSAELDSKLDSVAHIDAAVVDYNLGTEFGPHAVDVICASRGLSFPVLVVTGSTNTDTLQYLHRSGKPWITKPVDPDMLIAVLSGMMPRS